MAIKTAHLGGTDWADGDILYAADLNSTINEMGSVSIAAGTITLQAATTSFGTDYADISVPASLLATTDLLKLEFFGGSANVARLFQIGLSDTTNTTSDIVGDGGDTVGQANQIFSTTVNIYQDPSATTTLRLIWHGFSMAGAGPTALGDENTFAVGDANWITTSFTIRLDLKNASTASGNTLVYYNLRAIKRGS